MMAGQKSDRRKAGNAHGISRPVTSPEEKEKIMKKYTTSEILAYLKDHVRLLVENGKAIYSVAVDDDGNLVDRCTDHEACSIIDDPAAYLGVSSEEYDSMEDVDLFYDKEDMDDEDFREIVEALTDKINAIIEHMHIAE